MKKRKYNIKKSYINYFYRIPLTIAIDDSSHELIDQIAFIKQIWPHVKKGGLMIIEDLIPDNIEQIKLLGIPFETIDLREGGCECSILLIFRK